MDSCNLSRILRNWQIKPAENQPAITLPGSPERTVSREAVEDSEGRIWVIEQIAEETYSRKLKIAETLEQLAGRGLEPVHPWERNTLGQFITCYSGRLCMLRPHVEGVPLNRDTWRKEPWRAEAAARFLIKLKSAAGTSLVTGPPSGAPLSDYIRQRTETFRHHRPDMADALAPVFQGLEKKLFPILGTLPTALCHGDFHPLNIIWGEEALRSVIDWEFCGVKPEAYDAALLIGCIGFDNPEALIGDFTRTFIDRLRDAQLFAPETWQHLPELVIAIRYAWLTEWMRSHNESARDLEILYMNLLTTQKAYIRDKWGIG